jgi:HEXXH motif-containing protein
MLDVLPLETLTAPEADDGSAFFEEVVTTFAAQAMALPGATAALAAAEKDGGHSALAALVREHATAPDFATVWDPAFGALHASVATGAVTPERLATVALRLHECGTPGAWSATLAEEAALRFDRWPLPPGRALAVRAVDGHVDIAVDGIPARFARTSAGRWVREDGGAVTAPPLVEARLDHPSCPGTRAVVLRRRLLWRPEVADLAHDVDDVEYDRAGDRVTHALELLADHTPEYAGWVARVLRFVAPWRVRSNHRPTGSSSTNVAPGLVGVGNHDHAASLAESLVHEASHHYYYVATRLGPVADGSDTRLYPNPFFGRARPLDRILLAYHAFVNVHLYTRAALAGGCTDLTYLEWRLPQVAHGLRVLEDGIASSSALTPLGAALFTALRRLNQATATA